MMEEADDGDSFSMISGRGDVVITSTRNPSPNETFSPFPPDVLAELAAPAAPFLSLNLNSEDSGELSLTNYGNDYSGPNGSKPNGGGRAKSFLLMDERENIQLESAERFCRKLGVPPEVKMKVVSIFGNTGDGKSHTMNHAFFGGAEVFKTSPEQASCTMGIWASFHRQYNVLCLDTEGLLGETTNENRQMRMLLKVLAISDIVIYRTRSERLRSDMYKFLGTASKAFTKYFHDALESRGTTLTAQAMGPAVIIFQETQNTEILKENADGQSEEDILRENFAKQRLELKAFSSLQYVGVRTNRPPTNYEPLKMALEKELKNTKVRSPRQPKVVFEALLALNKKFNGELSSVPHNTFPDQYFTCTTSCKSCGVRCQLSMGHLETKEDHKFSSDCIYQHQYENKVYLCEKCCIAGRQVVVNIKTQTNNDSSWLGLAKYAWSGSVIECPHCGEIYRSRQHWYGNKPPEKTKGVKTKYVHVWDDGGLAVPGPTVSAQLVLDGVAYLTDAFASIGAQPTQTIKSWVTDKIRPTYWRPDSEIIHCKRCVVNFERFDLKKHHCRNCGEGFCSSCSKDRIPVISRGWTDPVRVCIGCYEKLLKAPQDAGNGTAAAVIADEIEQDLTSSTGNGNLVEGDVLARKYGEVVINTLSNIGAVLEYPKDLIKDSARPSYWVPDSEAPRCHICALAFGLPEEINLSTPMARGGSPVNGRRRDFAGSTDPSLTASPSRSSPQAADVIDRRRHHCRACGNAICAACSEHRRPVPKRGWMNDVRVCNNCINKAD